MGRPKKVNPWDAPVEELQPDGRTFLKYKNGMVRVKAGEEGGGRLVHPPIKNMIATSERSLELHQRKVDLKREAVQKGANAVVQGLGSVKDGKVFAGQGLDFVEAISEQVTLKALDHTDVKQVDAFRAIMQESGYAERQQIELPVTPANNPALAMLVADVAKELLDEIAAGRLIVDAKVIPE